MCGIAGICNLREGIPPDPYVIGSMISRISHRGPDEAGVYVDDHAGLGHSRLSIIDLAGGTQPIHNEDESLWIIYNGETFNYPELRRELERSGHEFYTDSDTEVVLHLYEEKGARCLDDMNGQFALAIWDSRRKELFVARDRMGIRPLHYTFHDNALIFASEIKAIFSVPGVRREIDPVALNEVFTYWTTLPGRTMFEDIRELPPGHYLVVSEGRIRVKRYWDVPFAAPETQASSSAAEVSERIRSLLQDATRIRLRADVPVGTYLSGGLDSSGVTAIVARDFKPEVQTFGIRFADSDFDEGKHQRCMVSSLKTRHHELLATSEMIGNAFPETVWHTEKVLLRTAPVPLLLLSSLVRRNGLKVVLTGEGADEVFGGYNIFRETKVRRFWAEQPGSAWRGALVARLYPYVLNDPRLLRSLQTFFARGMEDTANPLYSHLVRWNGTSRITTFLSQRNNTDLGSSLARVRAMLPEGFDRWDYLCKAQYIEMMIFLGSYLLSSQGDRVAMANSVEIRLPYLDYRLIEYAATVPAKMKIRGLNEKYILKRSFRGMLPPEITGRRKHPYRAPIASCLLRGGSAGIADDMLSVPALHKTGMFDAGKVTRLVNKLKSVENPSEFDSMALVGILSAQLLHQCFVEHFAIRKPALRNSELVVDRRSRGVGDQTAKWSVRD